jgi:hypothetical protein
LARRADPIEFNDVTKVPEAESITNVVGPLLEFGGVDFNGRAAQSTRKVVVVRFDDAASIQALAAIGHYDVDVTVLHEFLELGVDGRQGDVTTVALDEGVKSLGADETGNLAQNSDDFSALDGVS